jgi:hypothetical protein
VGFVQALTETAVHDIHEKRAITNEAGILNVYTSLLCSSGKHLRAFNEQLLAQGVTYVPQVISQAKWDAIANTPQETCGG